MTTLVTGSNGLLGSALKKIGESDGFYFTSRAECDLENFSETLELMKRVSPQRIIHLAAFVGGVWDNSQAPADFFVKNMNMNLNVFRSAASLGVSSITSYASTCVFPEEASFPLRVEDMHRGEPHVSNFGYAYAKRMLAILGSSFEKQYGIKSTLVVPSNMYGPGEKWHSERSHVIPALISKIHRSKIDNSKLEVWGSGNAKREFVYSEDVARASCLLLNAQFFKPIIVSTGEEVSIRELVELLIAEMKFKGNVAWITSKPEGQLRKPSDSSTFSNLFPDFKFTTLREGLAETVDAFMRHAKNSS